MPIDPATDERILYFLEQGCSYREVQDSTGVSVNRLKKHYPGRGWTIVQAARFAADVRSILRNTMPEWRVHQPSQNAPAGNRR